MPRSGSQQAPEGAAELDPPEAVQAAELFGLLPQAARRDLVAGLDEVRS